VALSTDVVVVGAGVIGSAVAFELGRAGWKVVVVDKGAGFGQGSTSSSSAVMRFNYSTSEGVAIAWESFHCWTNWAAHLGADDAENLAELRQTGVVMLDVPIAPKDRATTLFAELGIPFEDWDSEELGRRVPGIDPTKHWPPKKIDDPRFWDAPTETLGALFTPNGGFVDDPMLATQNLADAAARHGARFVFKREVVGVLRAGRRVAGVVLADGERINASVVVNCAGPWSARFNALAGVGNDFTITVRPMRQEVHQVHAPEGYSTEDRPGPVIADLDLGTYMRPAAGNSMLIGGTEPECEPFEWIDDPDTSNPHRTTGRFESQVTRAARRFPNLRVPSQARGIAGVYDVASDWTPIYDRTELDGFYVAIGTSGNQFKNAPVAGQLMADLIGRVENGHDHDNRPLHFETRYTNGSVDLGFYSRKRETNPNSSGTVMG